MSTPFPIPPQPRPVQIDPSAFTSSASSSSIWDRISSWASENKAVVYTIAGVTLVVTAAGIYYYASDADQPPKSTTSTSGKKKAKKDRRKGKKDVESSPPKEAQASNAAKSASVTSGDVESELEELSEEFIASISEQERKEHASKLKAAGNKSYGSKDYNKAIQLYSRAIALRQDPIFYSNRAACHQAMGDWEKVVDDTTAAINLDSTYVKALNRRANAYEQLEQHKEALLDYTASCIVDKFQNPQSHQAVERLLEKIATTKGKAIFESKKKRLPSAVFVSNYLQSFRPKPPPAGLEVTADLPEDSGKAQLRKGYAAIQRRDADGYAEAAEAFDRALELGDLGEHEGYAYNMRATFRWLKGDVDDSMDDINKSIAVAPALTQSYVKRASMHLERMQKDAAQQDFETALTYNSEDPDIYYHRAQFHFIDNDHQAAAADYQKSIDLDKDFIFSHIQLGVTQYKQGSVASSMATFRRCIKNFDNVPDVYNYYGELLLDQQQFHKAIEQFNIAIDLERTLHPTGINVLPIINKALAKFQWKQDFGEAAELCEKALLIDPECDIAVATIAQLLLQQGNVTEALKYFERAAELSRTEGEIVHALQYAEATRVQLEVAQKYPQLAESMRAMGGGLGGQRPM